MAEAEQAKPAGTDQKIDLTDEGPLFNYKIMIRIAVLMTLCLMMALAGFVMAVVSGSF